MNPEQISESTNLTKTKANESFRAQHDSAKKHQLEGEMNRNYRAILKIEEDLFFIRVAGASP